MGKYVLIVYLFPGHNGRKSMLRMYAVKYNLYDVNYAFQGICLKLLTYACYIIIVFRCVADPIFLLTGLRTYTNTTFFNAESAETFRLGIWLASNFNLFTAFCGKFIDLFIFNKTSAECFYKWINFNLVCSELNYKRIF